MRWGMPQHTMLTIIIDTIRKWRIASACPSMDAPFGGRGVLGRIGGGLTENMGNDDGNRCGGRPLYYVWVCVLIVFGRNLDRYVYLFNSCG